MPLKTQQDEMPTMNLTAMIDVVFLLIVFFMSAASFADPRHDIDLRLPEVAKADAATKKNVARQVAVHADGKITLDGKPASLDELTAQLAAACRESPMQSVIILGDAACPFQQIAAALSACKEAGVAELGVSVRIAQGPASARR